MYNIVIHTDNPRLRDEYLDGILILDSKPKVTRNTSEWLIKEYPYRKPSWVPKRKNRFVDTGVVGKRLEIAETTYTSKYNEYTGELELKKVVDRYDSGLVRTK